MGMEEETVSYDDGPMELGHYLAAYRASGQLLAMHPLFHLPSFTSMMKTT